MPTRVPNRWSSLVTIPLVALVACGGPPGSDVPEPGPEPVPTAAPSSPTETADPCLSVEPEELDFGEVVVPEAAWPERTVRLINACSRPIDVQLELTADAFQLVGPPPRPLTILGGTDAVIAVEAAPSAFGVVEGQLRAFTADPAEGVVTVNLEALALCVSSAIDRDRDQDGVPDACDACAGFDDATDADADGVPDGCDACPGFDDRLDADADDVPDGCDRCPDFDDFVDTDGDTVPGDRLSPGGCDAFEGVDNRIDADGDGFPDVPSVDRCLGFDDTLDADGDGV
ncbi:MAG: hypothetical protein AAF602_04950, partial [Myxococcota bacterium]